MEFDASVKTPEILYLTRLTVMYPYVYAAAACKANNTVRF